MSKSSARVGAAAFVLGLSLAGSPGVAAADSGDGDSSARSAASGEASQKTSSAPSRSPSTGARSAQAVQSAATTGRRAVDAERAAVRAPTPDARRDSGPVADAAPKPSAATVPPVPAGADLTRDDDVAPQRVPATPAAATAAAEPFAKAVETCSSCGAFVAKPGVPAAGQAVTALVRGAKFLDDIDNWLNSLPPSPINEVLSGALLLVRRTLFPMVPTIPVASVRDAAVDEDAGRAVFTVTLDRAYSSPVTVGYATDSSLSNPGAEAADIAARATADVDYQAASGILTFAPGQTSQQISVTIHQDTTTEVAETFSMDLFATWTPGVAPAAASDQAAATATQQLTPVLLATATATIVDDDRVKIDVNPNFAYGDALWAGMFSNLAYNHRNDADFTSQVQATGWQGIGIADAARGANGYSPAAGGYGVRDGLTMQSYAFAGKRTAVDGTVQFVVAFEGSNMPWEEPADWIVNAGQYGWSRYYSSVEPLMAEVVGQMLEAQNADKKTQLILTGHSLGGAAATMAFADLLAPEGNLWPGTASVLADGDRVLDAVGGWTPEVRTALLAATSVYTFGAPSILIEPNKPSLAVATAFAATAATSGFLGALALLPVAIRALNVDDETLPDFTGLAGINFGTRVFQFEHANTDWLPPYTGDIVAQIGSRDPGTVLQINLDNKVQDGYTGGYLASLVPGTTHPIGNYEESVIRLVSNATLLKSPNKLAADSPQLSPTTPGGGSDRRNDFFVNVSDAGGDGNDLFVFSRPGSYAANGAGGSDAYSISSYDVVLLIDGAAESGRDMVVFDVAGTPGATYYNTGSGPSNNTAVFSVTASDGQSSSVTITNWDKWQVNDVLQVIKPSDGRWTLDVWTGIERGPVIAVGPANEIPASVL